MSELLLGVDLGGTKIEAALLSPDGTILRSDRVPTPVGDYRGTLSAIAQVVTDLEAACQCEPTPLGLGIPGSPSPATGLIRNANSTCLNGCRLETDLADLMQRPIRLANDANCLALSEAVDGAAAGAGVVFGIILGTGVGGGVVVDQRLIVGCNGVGGEWGHMPLPWPRDEERPGPRCYCGRQGCLETFLSGPAVEHEGRGLGINPDSGMDRATDVLASNRDLRNRWLDRLARSLAIIINVIDPDVIVVGGGLNRVAAIYEELPDRLTQWVFSDIVSTRIMPAMHGDSSGVRGAARLWQTTA